MSAEKRNARPGEPETGGFGKQMDSGMVRETMQAHANRHTVAEWLLLLAELLHLFATMPRKAVASLISNGV